MRWHAGCPGSVSPQSMAVAARAGKRLGMLMLLLYPGLGDTAELRVEVARLAWPGLLAEGIELRIDWPERRAPQGLSLALDRLQVEWPALDLEDVQYRCRLESDAALGASCSGDLAWRGGDRARRTGTMRVRLGVEAVEIDWREGDTRLAVSWPLSETEPVRVEASAVPAPWLQPELVTMWPEARLVGGRLDAEAALTWDATDAVDIDARLQLTGFDFDTVDGSVAAAAVDASGQVRARLAERAVLDLDLEFRAGEVLFDRLYVELPPRPLLLKLQARERGEGRWRLDGLRVEDAEAFNARGSVDIDMQTEVPVQAVALTFDVVDAGEALGRYADSLLALAGLAGMRAQGGLSGEITLDHRGLRALDLHARALDLVDRDGRFAVHGIDGGLAFGPDAAVRRSTLAWAGARFYLIELGATVLHIESGGGRIALREPARVDVAGGRLVARRGHWQQGEESADFGAALAVEDLDLGVLTEAFGWPPFGGRLSGNIPAVRYDDGVLVFDGGLDVGVFDGRVTIESLSLERPFGVLPTLNADIRFSGLDLQQITRVFDVGEIQGRLMGHVLGLRLIDWAPVAFDAVLRTEKGAGPRRISQRAVESLSSVGGGGGVAALQSSVLRVFSTFSYDEIGLSCRLQNHVCRMDGVDSVGQGYAIVKGSGLPRISVVGHQRQVDWPVLLGRLQSAIAGTGPVMN